MISPSQFAAILEREIGSVHPKLIIGLDKVGILAQTLAASYPGHYQSGWKELSPFTIADKEASNWPSPSPLLRSGDMAESIHRVIDPIELGVVIGSNDKKALWQEMGTVKIPPRPFLALGMQNSIPYAVDIFNEIAVELLSGK